MSVKQEQMTYVIMAALLCGALMYFMVDPVGILGVAGTFLLTLGSFLSLDLVNMLKKTAALSPSQFEPMKKHRYVLGLVLLILLTVWGFVISKLQGKVMDGVYGLFGGGSILVLGFLCSGIEANKIVTGAGPAQPEGLKPEEPK